MSKFLKLLYAVALMSAICVWFVACNEPKNQDISVETDFVIVNKLEYPSDIVVELKDGKAMTIAHGDERVIHTYGETAHAYNADGTPAVKVPYTDAIPDASLKAYGAAVPAAILAKERWTANGEKAPGASSIADYRYTVTLTITNGMLKELEGPEPDTHIREYALITNSLDTDIITIIVPDGWSTEIKPGEEKRIDIEEYTIPWGATDTRDRVVLHADMIVRNEIVQESVWLADVYWESVREDGEDEYHYSRRLSLNVTEELLEKVNNSENKQ